MPAALMEESRERKQCQRWAAMESPKEAQSRTLGVEVQPAGVCLERSAAKDWLTSTREKRTAQRRSWETESEVIAERAESSQEVADVGSW